jgi:hypothetical protein
MAASVERTLPDHFQGLALFKPAELPAWRVVVALSPHRQTIGTELGGFTDNQHGENPI